MTVDQVRRQVAGAVTYRAASASTYDPAARTIELIAATETPVLMPGWRIGIDGNYLEILDMSRGAVDLSSVAAGNCPLLDAHNRYELAARLGGITSAYLDGASLITKATFGQSDAARSAESEMTGAVPPKVSAGYRVTQYQFERFEADRTPVYRATAWTLCEVSLVPIAADPNAGVRAEDGSHPCVILETRAMREDNNAAVSSAAETEEAARAAAATAAATATAAAESERAAAAATAATVIHPATSPALTVAETLQLQDQARLFGVETQTRAAFEVAGATAASVGVAILAAAAVRQTANTGGVAAGGAARVTVDERDTVRSGLEAAMILGLNGHVRNAEGQDDAPRIAAARAYRGMTLSELASTALGERSMPRTAADRLEVLTRAFHVTSDFPNLLSNALNQRLLEQYAVAVPTYRRIAQQMTFMDFRAHDLLRAGDFPALQPVSEAGEIKFGTFGEKKETAVVASYGVQFALSRQLLVNDRLNAMEQVLSSQGAQVALFEEKTFFAMKAVSSGVGPALKEDATAVYATGHNNYTSSGTAISTTSLGIGRAKIRKQKNLQGDQMGLAPSILLVSPDTETVAESVLFPLGYASQAANVNLFAGKLELVVGGQLTGNAWELYTDIALGSNWVWGLLDGFQAPRLKVEEAFGTQGVKVSLEHDFGCGAQDYRFGYLNAGA